MRFIPILGVFFVPVKHYAEDRRKYLCIHNGIYMNDKSKMQQKIIMSKHLREAPQHHLLLQMVLLSLLVITVIVTGETTPVMKSTGADDCVPGDSVWFMVQDGR